MGTRCDFYVGRGEKAEWLGSVAWDGDPENFEGITTQTEEKAFRATVALELKSRDDSTTPNQGWPWPWDNSRGTDYTIAFENGKVWASCFGRRWYEAQYSPGDEMEGPKEAVFPNMKAIQNVTFGNRSGLMIAIGPKKKPEE